ncbi:class I SAM-dependent methyltransferase [Pseudonocardiaceae bacterium YIM PH 21723]|nr:class I SAM-dependent methyltransferase [Pseudonocardiaceae bacterium YIM PH 21723]
MRLAAGRARALGLPTRGTTNPNRLRRVDRWMLGNPLTRQALQAPQALVVDLGYGATPITTVEMFTRLRTQFPEVRVLGLELDPDRVAAGKEAAAPPDLDFRRGGFELAGARPAVIRAFNVLRQYTEQDAVQAWQTMLSRVAPGGLLVEGTCDEIGRRCCWTTLTVDGPQSFTIACLPAGIETPSDVAERLPKSLIHRNVAGERVHELLATLDACWASAAPFSPYGPRARWVETITALAGRGWPVLDTARRWRLGEVTLDYAAVAPL